MNRGRVIYSLMLLLSLSAPAAIQAEQAAAPTFAPLSSVFSGKQSIEIQGELDAKSQNPRTGRIYSNMVARISFSVLRSGAAWKIAATNRDDRTWWTEVVYDGTNTFMLNPAGGNYYFKQAPGTNANSGAVWQSSMFYPENLDMLEISPIWLAYCLSPRGVVSNKNGVVDMPVPWLRPRKSPLAYGYKWLITPSRDQMFIEACNVVRDRSLDLSSEELELLRPELDYPHKIGDLNKYRFAIQVRKAIPNGFVDTRYKCGEWSHTNANWSSVTGVSVPVVAEFTRFLKDSTNYPVHQAVIKTTAILVHEAPKALEPTLRMATEVDDYRYKRTNDSRIYGYAEYTLNPGEPWKPANDPVLLAQAEEHLRTGPKYGDYQVSGRSILVWSVISAAALAPVLAALWQVRQKRNKAVVKSEEREVKV